jgi:hypothetical protein
MELATDTADRSLCPLPPTHALIIGWHVLFRLLHLSPELASERHRFHPIGVAVDDNSLAEKRCSFEWHLITIEPVVAGILSIRHTMSYVGHFSESTCSKRL